MTHYIEARRAGTLAVVQKKPRRSPPGLVSGTSAYAKWWREQNRERHLQLKRESNRRRRANDPTYRARQEQRSQAALRLQRLLQDGAPTKEIAASTGRSETSINSMRTRLGLAKVRGPLKAPMSVKRAVYQALATPKWVDTDALFAVYAEARRRRRSGEDVVVDHIVPIRGKGICGLHVPWNLQIIPRLTNALKRDRIIASEIVAIL